MKTLTDKSLVLKQKIKNYKELLQQFAKEIELTDELSILELDCQMTKVAKKLNLAMENQNFLRN